MAATIAEPPHLAADLKVLRLSTVAAQWQPLAEQALRQRQTPADYLAQLVHLEVTARRERRIQRRIQDARFPMLKTLDAFSFEAQPDLDRDAVLQVFDCRFVAEGANVVFVGGVGTGKTHLSIALGMACCQHDYRVRFVTAAELVTMLVEAQQQGRLARKLAQLARYDVVHVDELGYVPLDKTGADLLFGFISQRYERPEPGDDDESAVRALVRGLPRPDGGRRGHRPGRAPRDRTADHGRQLQVGGREAEPGAGRQQEGGSLMPLGCVPRFEGRSCGPDGVSTRCARPPLRYGPAGDTPSVPPLRQQIWALRPGLDGGVPAVHNVSRDAGELPASAPGAGPDPPPRRCSRQPPWNAEFGAGAASDDVLTKPTGGSLFKWPQGSLFQLPFPPCVCQTTPIRRSPRAPAGWRRDS